LKLVGETGMGAIEFSTVEKFLTEWFAGKEATKTRGTVV